ncbi:hypothetical protein BaRGS_00006329, partial [Batillaria attramentaria]
GHGRWCMRKMGGEHEHRLLSSSVFNSEGAKEDVRKKALHRAVVIKPAEDRHASL